MHDFHIAMALAVLISGTAFLVMESLRLRLFRRFLPDPPQWVMAGGLGILTVTANAANVAFDGPTIMTPDDSMWMAVLAAVIFYFFTAINWVGILIVRRLCIETAKYRGWMK